MNHSRDDGRTNIKRVSIIQVSARVCSIMWCAGMYVCMYVYVCRVCFNGSSKRLYIRTTRAEDAPVVCVYICITRYGAYIYTYKESERSICIRYTRGVGWPCTV